MGCAMQDVMETTPACAAAVDEKTSIKISSQQLKEQHSALVRLLESAPLSSQKSSPTAQTAAVAGVSTLSSPAVNSSNVNSSNILTSPTIDSSAIQQHPHQQHQQQQQRTLQYRKRLKLDRSMNCDQNVKTVNCNFNKSSYCLINEDGKPLGKADNESGIDDDIDEQSDNDTINSDKTDETFVCPWKKIRFAREWKQRHTKDCFPAEDGKLPMDGATTTKGHQDPAGKAAPPMAKAMGDATLMNNLLPSNDLICDKVVNNSNVVVENYQQHRRDSSDSNSSVLSNSSISGSHQCTCGSNSVSGDKESSMIHQHVQQQVQQQCRCNNCLQHDDSGCDDEICENFAHTDQTVADLCQKFDENLSNDCGNNGKGFFRRSIQQKIQYRPCTKNQQCSILRINRNRCQYCRLKKCIAVGMSRDAVRFGRVPKREKARILAAMQQSTQNRGQQRALATELDDQPRLLAAVLRAHMETCEFTKDKVAAMRQRARECPSYSMPTLLACPLNPAPELQSEQEFSQRFAHVIRGVIDFAGMIPGFQLLTQDDKFTLLKAGLFDALFVRLICMFDSSINSIICLNGQVMRRDAIQNGANARFLVDSTFNFAERINSMNLTDTEIGLFCAIVLITPDRPGLRNVELIEKMYSRLKACLQGVISQNRPDQPEFMSELLKTLPDLRTLSTLHTEKLVVFRTEHKELLRQQMWSMEEDQPSKSPGSSTWEDNRMEDVAKSPLGSVSSTESGDLEYSQSSLASSAPLLAATLSGACPLRHRANSGSSAEDVDIAGSCPHAHLAQNGLTITPVVRSHSHTHLASRYRKLDSPTDSGIESGNEKAESTKTVSSGGSSSCSSPRSSVDDALDEHAAATQAQNSGSIATKRQIVEDMPVLKRVLQAPPLYDTNSLMDEAYKPHKKFRALRHREFETAEADANVQSTPVMSTPHHQSQLHMHLTRSSSTSCIHSSSNNNSSSNNSNSSYHHNNQHSSLSSTHSVLAKSLMEEPRMTPEQMKRTDIIQNYIMREQPSNGLLVCATSPAQHCPYSSNPPSASSSNSNCSSPSTTTVTLASPPPPPPHAMRWQGHSVITTTTLRQSTSPNGIACDPSGGRSSNYFQSPHSTSVSPPRPSPSAQSPRLLELQVDIADSQQPLNLSKKSPTPPPSQNQSKSAILSRQYPVAADVTVTATTAPSSAASGTPQVHKVLLEA